MSRDETERVDFGDDRVDFGGIFDRVLKPFKRKVGKKISVDLKAKGATPAQVALMHQAMARAKVTPKNYAQGLVSTVKIGAKIGALVVPGGAAAVGGLVAADKLAAGVEQGSHQARSVVDATKALASAGHVDAQRGLSLLGQAAQLRASVSAPRGVPQPVNASGAAAYGAFLASRKPVVVTAKPAPTAPAARGITVPGPVLPTEMPPIAPRPVAPVAARVALRPMAPASAQRASDWFVDDLGRVKRVVPGDAVQGRGWYASASTRGVLRLG